MDAIRTYHTGITQDALLRQPELKELRNSLLLGAHDFYRRLKENLEGRRSNNPATRLKLAEACLELGRLAGQISSNEDARASLRAGPGPAPRLVDEYPEEAVYHRTWRTVTTPWANSTSRPADTTAAETAFRAALLMQENLMRDHPVNDQDRNEFAAPRATWAPSSISSAS